MAFLRHRGQNCDANVAYTFARSDIKEQSQARQYQAEQFMIGSSHNDALSCQVEIFALLQIKSIFCGRHYTITASASSLFPPFHKIIKDTERTYFFFLFLRRVTTRPYRASTTISGDQTHMPLDVSDRQINGVARCPGNFTDLHHAIQLRRFASMLIKFFLSSKLMDTRQGSLQVSLIGTTFKIS